MTTYYNITLFSLDSEKHTTMINRYRSLGNKKLILSKSIKFLIETENLDTMTIWNDLQHNKGKKFYIIQSYPNIIPDLDLTYKISLYNVEEDTETPLETYESEKTARKDIIIKAVENLIPIEEMKDVYYVDFENSNGEGRRILISKQFSSLEDNKLNG